MFLLSCFMFLFCIEKTKPWARKTMETFFVFFYKDGNNKQIYRTIKKKYHTTHRFLIQTGIHIKTKYILITTFFINILSTIYIHTYNLPFCILCFFLGGKFIFYFLFLLKLLCFFFFFFSMRLFWAPMRPRGKRLFIPMCFVLGLLNTIIGGGLHLTCESVLLRIETLLLISLGFECHALPSCARW